MLVLKRRRDETVVIGDLEIVVKVVDIRADACRLGIVAPTSIPVHRGEIYESIAAEGRPLLFRPGDEGPGDPRDRAEAEVLRGYICGPASGYAQKREWAERLAACYGRLAAAGARHPGSRTTA